MKAIKLLIKAPDHHLLDSVYSTNRYLAPSMYIVLCLVLEIH